MPDNTPTTDVTVTKKTVDIQVSFAHDIRGSRIFAKAPKICELGERLSEGQKTLDGRYWAFRNNVSNVPGFSDGNQSIRNLFRSTKLGEGVEVPFQTDYPNELSIEKVKQECERVRQIMQTLIQRYMVAIRISFTISVDEGVLKFDEKTIKRELRGDSPF